MRLTRWVLPLLFLCVFAMPVLGMDTGPPGSGVVLEQQKDYAFNTMDVNVSDQVVAGDLILGWARSSGLLTSFSAIENTNLINLVAGKIQDGIPYWKPVLASNSKTISYDVALSIPTWKEALTVRKFFKPYVKFAVASAAHRNLKGGLIACGQHTKPHLWA